MSHYQQSSLGRTAAEVIKDPEKGDGVETNTWVSESLIDQSLY